MGRILGFEGVILLGNYKSRWLRVLATAIAALMPAGALMVLESAPITMRVRPVCSVGLFELTFNPMKWKALVRLWVQELDDGYIRLLALPANADGQLHEGDILCSMFVPEEGWRSTKEIAALN